MTTQKTLNAAKLVDILDVSQANQRALAIDAIGNVDAMKQLSAARLSSRSIVEDKDGDVRLNTPATNITFKDTVLGSGFGNVQDVLDNLVKILGSTQVDTIQNSAAYQALAGTTAADKFQDLTKRAPANGNLMLVGHSSADTDSSKAGIWAYDGPSTTWLQILDLQQMLDDRILTSINKLVQLVKAVTMTLVYNLTAPTQVISLDTADVNNKKITLSPAPPYEGVEVFFNGVRMVMDNGDGTRDFSVDFVGNQLNFNSNLPINSWLQVDVLLPNSQVNPASLNMVRLKDLDLDATNTAGQFDGIRTEFPLVRKIDDSSITPGGAMELALFVETGAGQGRRLIPDTDYTVTGDKVQFTVAPATGMTLWGLYYESSAAPLASTASRGTVSYITDTTPAAPFTAANNYGFGAGAVTPDITALPPQSNDFWFNFKTSEMGIFSGLAGPAPPPPVPGASPAPPPLTSLNLTDFVVDGPLDMLDFLIQNVADPRPGTVGQKDAVNRQTMEASIAAGALYQGIYKIVTNRPDLAQKADVTVAPLVAGDELNKPAAGGASPDNPATDAVVWFDLSLTALHATNFPFDLNVVTPFEVRLSNQRAVKINLDAKSYTTWATLFNEIHDKLAVDVDIINVHYHHSPTELWLGIETVVPIHALWVTDQLTSPYPAAVAGPNNTVLNTYNWIVQTLDENTPEFLPPGLPGLEAGTLVKNSDILQWNGTSNGFEIISGSSLTQAFADQRYWRISQGNMRWIDQAYDRGALVYGARVNAWFAAQQNIPVGSPEPGTIAAAGIWRKVNSTYGATVFFGTGDYDPSDTTAANNWGMPTGTYPSGQQPVNGDSYYDILTGAVTDFTVVYSGTKNTIEGTADLAMPGNAQLGQTWPQVFTNWDSSMPQGVPTGQVFNKNSGPSGQSLTGTPWTGSKYDPVPANKPVYFVWGGDPDASDVNAFLDSKGWVLLYDDGSPDWKDYVLDTPHPQVVPDVITPHITYGFARNFAITIPVGTADDAVLAVLDNIAEHTQIVKVEIRADEADGAVVEFELLVSGSDVLMSPIAVISHNSYIKEIQAHHRAADNIILALKFNADAAGKVLHLRVESADGYIGSIASPMDAATFTAGKPTINGLKDYPDPVAQQAELIATSSDADIQIPQFFTRSSLQQNVAQTAFDLAVPPKRYLKAMFLCQPNGTGSWPQMIGQRKGNWIDWSVGVLQGFQYWNNNGTYGNVPNVDDIAKDNSGLSLWREAPEAGKFFRTIVEVTIYKNHTTFHIHANSIFGPGVRNYDCVVHYNGAWNDLNYLGFKIGSTTFSFIEAYIQWE